MYGAYRHARKPKYARDKRNAAATERRHLQHNMRSRVYVTVGRPSVDLSVCPSVPALTRRKLLVRVCCWVPGGQEMSIDCCVALNSSDAAVRRLAVNVGSNCDS